MTVAWNTGVTIPIWRRQEQVSQVRLYIAVKRNQVFKAIFSRTMPIDSGATGRLTFPGPGAVRTLIGLARTSRGMPKSDCRTDA